MKILITGSSGFIGKNLTKHLSNSGYDFQKLSLRDKEWKNQISEKTFEVYIHLAGIAYDIANVNNDKIYYEVNYELTKEIFELFLDDQGAKTFIYFSSIKALSDYPETSLTEKDKPDPKTVYGKSKKLAEDFILENLPRDKQVFILRPCMIHGPGNKGNLNVLIKWVEKGIPWFFGAFKNKRSYCNIENLCFIVDKLLKPNNIASGVYHIADDGFLSTNDLVALIGSQFNKKVRFTKVPVGLIRFLASIGSAFRLPFNKQVLNKVTGSYQVSNKKIKMALEIEQLPVSIHEGFRNTVKQNIND